MRLIYFVLFLCLAGLCGFLNYTLGQQPFQLSASNLPSPLSDVDYLYYGRGYRQQPSFDKSNTNQSVIRAATKNDTSKKISTKELNKFKGLLDLSNDSFTYVLNHMRPSEVDQLMGAGLILIQLHPKKARRYANRLLECQLVHNQNLDNEETFPIETERASHIPITSLNKGIDSVNDIDATLSVSALSFYNWFSWTKLFDFIWFLLQALYYTTTVVVCLLVALFIGDRWLDRPSTKTNSTPSTLWPPAPFINGNASGKTFPHAIPL